MQSEWALLLCCTALAPFHTAVARAPDASIEVRCDQPGHVVSPRLIGLFFEDINFGADGGLVAELVKNGSFETPAALLGWSQLGGAKIEPGREAPLTSTNPTFLRITASEGSSGGASNEGFRKMGLREGQAHVLTLHARASANRGSPVRARLVSEEGELLAEEAFRVEGSAWRRHEIELTPNRTHAKAHFELLLDGPGVVDVDNVSLCPRDTWRGRPNGLRKDVVQLLADMKPAFFRFPGGCIVEGSQLKYRYQWKTTIGPRHERRMLVNRWNTEFGHRPAPDYYQSFALGFYEYFLLSEDLGAEPMPILNCGMACQFNTGELVPMEELNPYIQDALDLVEFANGPVDSPWGAKRAAMGHPEPFHMRLLGIGNEQWGPEYFERYERFAQALQRENPEIELISTSGPFPSGERFDYAWPILRKLGVPIVDEHCYAMPDWFLREAHRFDDYDRRGPKVFMGEYAAQSVQIASPNNRNTLRCAIAEAAFLTGVERNSDVVTMSAYAPLSAHEEAWQWRPNLIWFDNLHSYGTPNYYVQKLFSTIRGDRVAPVEIDDPRTPPPPGGRIGLGTYHSSVEFRDLRVSRGDEVLFAADDLVSLESVALEGGRWSVESGAIRQDAERGSARALWGDAGWRDYTLEFRARKTGGREGFAVFFRDRPGGSRIEWNVGGWNNSRHGLTSHQATHIEDPTRLAQVEGSIKSGVWHDARVELRGDRVRCYLDGKLIHDEAVPGPAIDRLFASATVQESGGETILKVVNPTDEPTLVSIVLDGCAAPPTGGVAVTLTGAPDDENSIASPRLVAPVETELRIDAAEFDHEFPAHSLTVLRLAHGQPLGD